MLEKGSKDLPIALSRSVLDSLRGDQQESQQEPINTTENQTNCTLRFSNRPERINYDNKNKTLNLKRTVRGEYLLEEPSEHASDIEGTDKGSHSAQGTVNTGRPIYRGVGQVANDVECVLIYNEEAKMYELHMLGLDVQVAPVAKPRYTNTHSSSSPMTSNTPALHSHSNSASSNNTNIFFNKKNQSLEKLQRSPIKNSSSQSSPPSSTIPSVFHTRSRATMNGKDQIKKVSRDPVKTPVTTKTDEKRIETSSRGSHNPQAGSQKREKVEVNEKPKPTMKQSSPLRTIRRSMDRAKAKPVRLEPTINELSPLPSNPISGPSAMESLGSAHSTAAKIESTYKHKEIHNKVGVPDSPAKNVPNSNTKNDSKILSNGNPSEPVKSILSKNPNSSPTLLSSNKPKPTGQAAVNSGVSSHTDRQIDVPKKINPLSEKAPTILSNPLAPIGADQNQNLSTPVSEVNTNEDTTSISVQSQLQDINNEVYDSKVVTKLETVNLDEDIDNLADDLALELDEVDDSGLPTQESQSTVAVAIGTAGLSRNDEDSSSEEE